MYMTKEKFDEIKRKHRTLLVLAEDAAEALEFVQELLEAEVDALKEKCAYATRSIAETESAAIKSLICGTRSTTSVSGMGIKPIPILFFFVVSKFCFPAANSNEDFHYIIF